MNEEMLLTFLAVAYAGSFSKAAEQRSYSVPTIMSQINELEGYLGTALFKRTNRCVTLTEAGKRFLPEAEDIVVRFNYAIQCVRMNVSHQKPHHIRIGTTPLLPVSLLNGKFFRFLQTKQHITFEIVPLEDPIIINEETNPFDRVDLIGFPLDHESLTDHFTTYTLFYAKICVSVPFTHSFVLKDAISLKDLNHQTICCRNSQFSDGTQTLIERIHQQAPEARIISSDDFYCFEHINQCIASNHLFLSMENCTAALPFMKHIPLLESDTIPYGIVLSPSFSKKLQIMENHDLTHIFETE